MTEITKSGRRKQTRSVGIFELRRGSFGKRKRNRKRNEATPRWRSCSAGFRRATHQYTVQQTQAPWSPCNHIAIVSDCCTCVPQFCLFASFVFFSASLSFDPFLFSCLRFRFPVFHLRFHEAVFLSCFSCSLFSLSFSFFTLLISDHCGEITYYFFVSVVVYGKE